MMLRNQMMKELPVPDLILYLDTDPLVCHQRIHSLRARDCESSIPLEYLQGLNECYHSFLKRCDGVIEILKIEWNHFGNSNHVAHQVKMRVGNTKLDNGFPKLIDEREMRTRMFANNEEEAKKHEDLEMVAQQKQQYNLM